MTITKPQTHAYPSLNGFVQGLSPGGSLIVVGGHYDWPGPPGRHAIQSAGEVLDLAAAAKADRSYIFLNDMGALSSCNSIGAGLRSKVPTVPGLADWAARHLPAMEKELAAFGRVPPDLVTSLAELLPATEARQDASELLRLSTPFNCRPWLGELERLLYLVCRKNFRPLLQTLETGRVLPPILFEKTMNNGASRRLHKLLKGAVPTRLQVRRQDDVTLFQVAGPDGSPLLLRREIQHEDKVQAANMCSALLAQLFFSLARPYRTSKVSHLTICYLIPCYDRTRLMNGFRSFFELYGQAMGHWFGLEKMTLASCFFTGSGLIRLMCDVAVGDSETDRPYFFSQGVQ